MKMKKNILLAALISCSVFHGQINIQNEVIAASRAAENSKSGNYKDIFAGFYQLLATDLSGENKTIEFNSTLYKLKAQANPSVRLDYNYLKETFSRNLQFNFKANLDDDFNYEGFTGGVTYAILNARDKSVVTFDRNLHNAYAALQTNLDNIQTRLIIAINANPTYTPAQKAEKIGELNALGNQVINQQPITSTDTVLQQDYIRELNSEQVTFANLNGTPIADVNAFVTTIYNSRANFYSTIETKPLLTLSVNGTADKHGKFNKASIGTIFLAGNASGWNEIDLRANLNYADTLLISKPRANVNMKAGINFKIGKAVNNKSVFEVNKSVFEVKVYGEYNAIVRNVEPDEKKSNFLANADLRIRLTDDLWIPFTIKYDTESANFLGFMNISYNFGEK